MKHTLLLTILPALVLSSISPVSASTKRPTSGDVVIQWNLIASKTAKAAKQNSNLASRTLAVEAIAVYDAVNSIKHIGTPYHYYASPAGPASAQAAVAQAAHDVLTAYFPAQKAALDSALAVSLQGANDGPIDNGCKVGAASAADIIALRAADGSSPLTTYGGPATASVGAYRPTPGKFAPVLTWNGGRLSHLF
jgi:hypothetical protein